MADLGLLYYCSRKIIKICCLSSSVSNLQSTNGVGIISLSSSLSLILYLGRFRVLLGLVSPNGSLELCFCPEASEPTIEAVETAEIDREIFLNSAP